ncbi:peptidylprolyl isomerase [Antrihabitans cavernicola]|uniref:Peptidylprolyl isomerase n=1 Tax=Antrihabitans cavernicola TaxID=2495913 RepID=A0A5A7SDM8_9NOCA|nr:peptidylprolyl isomerase [Spelaeibacter cavernicola]KAA0023479.1 peptidylprolyl isomerase [Spelaeibacter cavernicola]
MPRIAVAAICAGLGVAVLGCSDDSGSSAASTTSASTTSADAATDMSSFGKLPTPPAPAGTVDCSYPSAGSPAKPVQPPETSGVATTGTKTLAMDTNQGPIGLTLNPAEAPCTVNSFVSLSTQGYYNDTPCHRLSTTGLKILQCGDPTGTGTGGPGYGYDNEYPSTSFQPGDQAAQQPVIYPRGTIAMANTGQPGSNGSQFFLVYDDSPLPPQYTVFGTISPEGIATIEKIAAAGDDGSMSAGGGKPNTPVQIKTVA